MGEGVQTDPSRGRRAPAWLRPHGPGEPGARPGDLGRAAASHQGRRPVGPGAGEGGLRSYLEGLNERRKWSEGAGAASFPAGTPETPSHAAREGGTMKLGRVLRAVGLA